jgi:hypothetical protein
VKGGARGPSSAVDLPSTARRGCSGPPLRVTLTAGDGLADPSVVTPIAPPPHAEERDCGRCDEDCADGPAIDIHGGEHCA